MKLTQTIVDQQYISYLPAFYRLGGMACEAQFVCGETNPRHRLYLKQEDPELYRLLNYIYNNNRDYLNSDTATCSWRNF